MTLRGLYDHVYKCIANRPNQSDGTDKKMLQYKEQQMGGQPTTEASCPPPPSRVRKPTISSSAAEAFFGREVPTSNDSITAGRSTIPTGERLGGYLHPRDMRRLVAPFSSSNAPELMVRRHVILMNFDPLRAILLRDRLLILVPDGSDSILIELQRRLQGKSSDDVHYNEWDLIQSVTNNLLFENKAMHRQDECDVDEELKIDRLLNHVAFEFQAVDAVLATVCNMLSKDASYLKKRIQGIIDEFRRGSAPGDHAQDRFRVLKDSMKELEGRVQGVVRALDQILDNDQDMALMNLSRLVTHPQRFIYPVSRAVLSEESEDSELILEAYLQQALSEYNALGLLRGNIIHAEDQVLMKLDTIRNRILYVNNIVTILGLCLTFAACIASFYGMNLQNNREESPNAFAVTFAIAAVASTVIFAYFMRMIDPSPSSFS